MSVYLQHYPGQRVPWWANMDLLLAHLCPLLEWSRLYQYTLMYFTTKKIYLHYFALDPCSTSNLLMIIPGFPCRFSNRRRNTGWHDFLVSLAFPLTSLCLNFHFYKVELITVCEWIKLINACKVFRTVLVIQLNSKLNVKSYHCCYKLLYW